MTIFSKATFKVAEACLKLFKFIDIMPSKTGIIGDHYLYKSLATTLLFHRIKANISPFNVIVIVLKVPFGLKMIILHKL